MRKARTIVTTLAGCLAVVSVFMLAYTGQVSLLSGHGESAAQTTHVPADAPIIRLIFVGSARCGASNNPQVAPALHAIEAALRKHATTSGNRFVMEGVSVDREWQAGLKFLKRVARFDEIVSGESWENVGARYLNVAFPGPIATPQVIVTRTQDADPEELLTRKVGVSEIVRWSTRPMDLNVHEEASAGDVAK